MMKSLANPSHHVGEPVDILGLLRFTFVMSPRQSTRPQKIYVSPLVETVTSDRPEVYAEFGDDVMVHGTLSYDGERYRLVRIEFSVDTHKSPEKEITSTLLRQLEVSKFTAAARQVIALALEGFLAESAQSKNASGRIVPAIPDADARKRIKMASRSRTANNTRGDAFYRRIALDLIELVESEKPMPGGILGALADLEGARLGRAVPIETLRTWIRIARDRKFLAPGVRGRMVAEPGRRLYSADDKQESI